MGKKSSPPPPDYTGAAQAQADSSRDVTAAQTFANRPKQITPWGTSNWTPGSTVDPTTGKIMTTWENELTLSPAEQAALESQQQVALGRSDLAEGLIGRTSNELQNPFAWQSLPDAGGAPTVNTAPRRYDMSGQPELVNPDLASLENPSNIDYNALPGLNPADFASLEDPSNIDYNSLTGLNNPDFAALNTPQGIDYGALSGLDMADFSSLINPSNIDYNSLTALNNPDFASLNTPQGVDYGALPGLNASGGYNPNFAQTAYNRSASLLEPRNQRALEAQDNQLRNQGLVPGTEAYDNAMGDLQDQQGETMSRLAQDSMKIGADMQDRQFGREVTTRGIYGDEAQQGFGNEAYIRDLLAGEQQQQFANTALARGMEAAEAQQGFGNEAYMRDLLAGEQQQQFANTALARGIEAEEAQQGFGNEAYIRDLLAGEQQQQFTNTALARGMEAEEAQQGFGNEAYMRDLLAGEQQQQFANSLQARGAMGAEAQQGFGNEAYMRNLLGQDMQQQFANTGAARELYSNEMNQGIQADMAAGQQQFDQSMQAANYQNQLRQQAMAEEAQRRGISINEMNALLTGQQVGTPQMPNFQAAQSSEAAQFLRGAEAQGNFGLEAQRNAQAPFNAFMGMAGQLAKASDKRLKENIEKVGIDESTGLNLYSFNYIGLPEKYEGVIAQEVIKTWPEAVIVDDTGFYKVNYGMLGLEMKQLEGAINA
tara:strand:- start:12235 stop:14370 length:2136 start_codon:yes stop_codon:yes gene_type:complete